MNITGYKSGYQRERAIDSYKDSLNIRAKLNEIYENANVETSRNKKYNITPIAQTKSAEEEVRDLTLQTEKAMANLKKMLKIDDAGAVLDKLRAGNELTTFNRFFNLFEKDVGNQSNLTPTAYYQLWERYKEKLLASGTTGIFIPSQKADIDSLVGEISQLLEDLGLKDPKFNGLVDFLYTEKLNKQLSSLYKLIKSRKEYKKRSEEEVLEAEEILREKEKWKSDYEAVMSSIIAERNKSRSPENANRFAALADLEDEVNKLDDEQEELFNIDIQLADLQNKFDEGMIKAPQFNEYRRLLEDIKAGRTKSVKKTLNREKARLAEEAEKKQTYEELLRKYKGIEPSVAESLIEEEINKQKKEIRKTREIKKKYKAQPIKSIESARKTRIDKYAKKRFQLVIDQINSLIDQGVDFNQYYNEPSPRSEFEKQLTEFADNETESVISQEAGSPTPRLEDFTEEELNNLKDNVENKVVEEVADVVADQMNKELIAFEAMAQEQLTEVKSEKEAEQIINETTKLQNEAVDYYTTMFKKTVEATKGKIDVIGTTSKFVHQKAINATTAELRYDQLNNMKEAEILKIANKIYSDTRRPENPSYKYKAKQQTFNAKSGKKHKLITYIIYHEYGVEIPRQKGGRVYAGKGIESAKNKYYEFGNYLIHAPQLEKGFLSLYYPSQCPIKEFPKSVISSDFIALLYEIINTRRFNTDEYEKLDDNEKELFDRLITFAKISRNDIENMSKHRKITDKQRDIDIKRFNILRGEIVAGNDNPNIIKEIKALLIKLHGEKIISKADFNKIMQNLVYLS